MEATALEIYLSDVCNRCVGDCPPKFNTFALRILCTPKAWSRQRRYYSNTKNSKSLSKNLKQITEMIFLMSDVFR
ncbi:hypothetical protein GQ457_12G018570 [Hibiscus cannabinus]